MYPRIIQTTKEDFADVETERGIVIKYDTLSLRPIDGPVIPQEVPTGTEDHSECENEATGKVTDTSALAVSEEPSHEQSDSVEGRRSSEDETSVIDESDIPMDNDFSKNETKDVIRLKLLVMLILVVSASTIAACVYQYISRSETSQFELKFVYDASKVLQSIGSSLERTLGLLDSVSVTMISYARELNDTWPFVTLPDFGVRMAKLLPLTDAFVVVVLPIIHSEKRKEWEEYAILHDHWVNESMAIQETWEGYYGPIIYDWEPHVAIHGDNGDIEGNVR
jgi:hypothetical protein